MFYWKNGGISLIIASTKSMKNAFKCYVIINFVAFIVFINKTDSLIEFTKTVISF